ncbi:MAG: 50S ribosome-binding GTPase, partial [Bacteroidales bacterium]|nr:50S ribosome-binding GTPase [Bacteroidales bacterium]
MAKDLKPHIGIFGRRNNGKSSLINLITGQAIAIVSECAGTTTDPVKKSIEIFGLGPCVLIDTAGIDDVGILGEQRIEKTWQIMDEIDCAIIVITDNQFGTPEKDLAERLQKRAVPFFVVHNKSDLNPLNENLKSMVEKGLNTTVLEFSTLASWHETALPTLVEMLKKTLPESAFQKQSLLGGLVKANETVVMVCPVDSEAPEGRLILPQVMAIRDALDN